MENVLFNVGNKQTPETQGVPVYVLALNGQRFSLLSE
jgi:hypothetical protein